MPELTQDDVDALGANLDECPCRGTGWIRHPHPTKPMGVISSVTKCEEHGHLAKDLLHDVTFSIVTSDDPNFFVIPPASETVTLYEPGPDDDVMVRWGDIEELRKRLRELAERVQTVVPYVTATIAPIGHRGVEGKPDWIEVHRGRASSSYRQLETLLKQAKEILRGGE